MQIKSSGDFGILYLSGIVHRESADAIAQMFEQLKDAGARTIVISFNNVKALLSDGIRLMVSLADSARCENREFFITDLPKEVQYTLKITNLLPLLGYAGSSVNLLKEKSIDESSLKVIESDAADDKPPQTAHTAQPEDSAPAMEKNTPVKAASEDTPPSNEQNVLNRIKSIGNLHTAQATPAQPAAQPAPQSKSKPAQPSARPAPKTEARQLSTHTARRLTAQELKLAIHHHVPGRMELQVVVMLIKSKKNIMSSAELAQALKCKESSVKKALKRLLKCATVTCVGGGLYNYAPSEDVKNQINMIIKLLRQRTTHSQTLKMLLDCEK